MKTIQRSAWLGITLAGGVLVGAAARDLLPRAQAQAQAQTNYEYQTVSVREMSGSAGIDEVKADKLLNRFAKEGWRFAGTLAHPNMSAAVFERPAAGHLRTPSRAPTTRNPEEID